MIFFVFEKNLFVGLQILDPHWSHKRYLLYVNLHPSALTPIDVPAWDHL